MIDEIERNNTRLQASQESLAAEKAGNRVGIRPADPVVGINYLKPNPRLADHRLDYSVSQELEFPTVYGLRRQVASRQDRVLDQVHGLQRRDLVDEALQTWLDWVYRQENRQVLQLQREHAEQLAEAYQRAFDAGSVSVLERNRARVFAQNAQQAVALNEIELEGSWYELIRLNGGQALAKVPQAYPAWDLPPSFEQWFSQVSDREAGMHVLEAELEVLRTEQQLATAMGLPNISLGYMREQDIEVDFRGFTLGLSLPLWQNRGRAQHARLKSRAQQSLLEDAGQQFELQQRHLYQKARALHQQLRALRSLLAESQEPQLLRSALDLGQISLLDYFMELGIYYDLQEKLVTAERDYYMTQAAMRVSLY
ncbi:MAG TPA: TolC family protein [Sphingobacteriaceae bacterium]|nr:TolC family protein [Sphingobacteriaceae bacterium]